MQVIKETITTTRVGVETERSLVPDFEGDGAVIAGDSAIDGEDVGDSAEDGVVVGVPDDGEPASILSFIHYIP